MNLEAIIKVGGRQFTVGNSRQKFLPIALCLLPTLILLICTTSYAQKPVPELWGMRVHDDAHALRTETVDALEKKLKLYEDSTSNQIAILIIPSLDGEVLEEYSIRVVEKWKLGTKEKDNGVLLLIAINDREMRIEVGMGLEGVLTDAMSNRIIRNEMAPNFRNEDYDAGVTAAIDAIILAIGGEYTADDISTDEEMPIAVGIFLFIFLGIFATVGVFSQGGMTWVLYVFLMPFYAAFMGALFGWWVFALYVIAYPLLRWRIKKSPKWKNKLLKWESVEVEVALEEVGVLVQAEVVAFQGVVAALEEEVAAEGGRGVTLLTLLSLECKIKFYVYEKFTLMRALPYYHQFLRSK
jgi:Beta-propeller domains of methanol dehydrogenase type